MKLKQEALPYYEELLAKYPKSPYAGAAFVRRMDIALEHLFEPKMALAVNKEAGPWARWAIGAPALESPKAATWAIVEKYPEQKALRHDVYDCLLRLGLVAYLIGDYKAAAEWIAKRAALPRPWYG